MRVPVTATKANKPIEMEAASSAAWKNGLSELSTAGITWSALEKTDEQDVKDSCQNWKCPLWLPLHSSQTRLLLLDFIDTH